MELRQLRYFLQIAESASLSRAARVLRVAQPSLSQHLRLLEDELGVELLTRHARGVAPTPAGRILADHARAILRDVDRSREAMTEALASPRGRVVIGIPSAVCRGLAAPLILTARRRFPDIALHLVEGMTGPLDEWVQSGRLDIALLYDRRGPGGIRTMDLLREDLHLILPVGHPLAGEGAVGFRRLRGLPLVLPARPHVIREVAEAFAARADTELSVALDCDSLPAMLALIGEGYGSLYPAFGIGPAILRGDVAAVAIRDPTPDWRLSLVLSHKAANMRAVAAIAHLVDEVVQTLVQSGHWKADLRRTGATPA
ncbi:LysR family transcriptional regulator [Aureimonas frigidaquae]|uniref:Putative transcriptional regulator, LysR family n=1 Tax=Aureimonas frigidaquae TaxID=424757 RepID=A0A0P0Z1N0_9HYPH|nr:LysR substrate-binding domain-containing protein [Aureimonas frigidaquae]BAT27895.1 putative transcriptional regulator, LysR family [Aureimonas frigidaquae]